MCIAYVQISVLGDLGGRTIDEFVRRAMGSVMNNNLTRQFSIYGRNGKRALGTSSLFTVIYRT